jgi:hypothetical protein
MATEFNIDASLRAVWTYPAHSTRPIPKGAVKSVPDEADESLLRNLGSVLAAHDSCKTVKHVHKMCNAVLPPLKATLRGLSCEDLEKEESLKYLQLLVKLDIPANLVKFMALALRAGYPLVPLPESAKATSEIAARAWMLGADFFRCLIGLCHNNRDSPTSTYSRALVEQLATGVEGQEPGKVLDCTCHLTPVMTAYGSLQRCNIAKRCLASVSNYNCMNSLFLCGASSDCLTSLLWTPCCPF